MFVSRQKFKQILSETCAFTMHDLYSPHTWLITFLKAGQLVSMEMLPRQPSIISTFPAEMALSFLTNNLELFWYHCHVYGLSSTHFSYGYDVDVPQCAFNGGRNRPLVSLVSNSNCSCNDAKGKDKTLFVFLINQLF